MLAEKWILFGSDFLIRSDPLETTNSVLRVWIHCRFFFPILSPSFDRILWTVGINEFSLSSHTTTYQQFGVCVMMYFSFSIAISNVNFLLKIKLFSMEPEGLLLWPTAGLFLSQIIPVFTFASSCRWAHFHVKSLLVLNNNNNNNNRVQHSQGA